ncbi:MAG: 16S rRNA (adenine(1518)-N(6)/adenine(1519)-N(6))-dimethyltransferase RsmA [Lachnospiraceae bacterium]|nr:16S rRNA (adenine(1518)-N(6)/adenine(1519)-N(6))-dimethyltransferase RsmA [Lachnospiraceae bacterium]
MSAGYLVDNTKAVMNIYGFTASKRFGQNFIRDRSVLEDIVKASGLTGDEDAVEIGPGIGVLTEFLAEAAGKVYAVEVDRKLIPILQDTLSRYDNIEIINQDILKTDLTALTGDRPFRIVANLPYYITTPIIMSLLETRVPCRSLTVMVQKEVGERMTAAPGNKNYGALTLAVEYYTRAEVVRRVPPGCFIPAPKVDSVVVHMDVYDAPPVKVKDERLLFALIRGAFNQRRKTLANALSGYAGLELTREQVIKAIEAAGKKPTVRGEELSLSDFAALADILSGQQQHRAL